MNAKVKNAILHGKC